MDWVGKTLGNYEIIAEIGSGSKATVYRGNQPSLNRQVAVKVLSDELARDKVFRERFLREGRAITQLTHPSILPVYDYGEDKETGALYFVMQLVEGGSLAQRMGQPMDAEAVARITAQIARALDYAHKRGLVHCNVKPSNVLLTFNGHPLLSDFVSLGASASVSPEQTQSGGIDYRTDIYALGAMAYEMLSGKPPFQADAPADVLHQHASTPPPLRALDPGLSKSIEKVVTRALAKDYASASEFADALEAAASREWNLPLPRFFKRPTLVSPVETPKTPDKPANPAFAPTTRIPLTSPAEFTLPKRLSTPVIHAGEAWLGWGKGLLRMALVLLAVLLIVTGVLLIVSLMAIGMLAEQTIAHQNWRLNQVDVNQTYIYYRGDFENGLRVAVEPYTWGMLTDIRVVFEPPDKIVFSGSLQSRRISLQIRLRKVEGIPNVQVERFNDVPLYIIGDVLSGRVNSGFAQVWKSAPILIDTMTVEQDRLTATYRRR